MTLAIVARRKTVIKKGHAKCPREVKENALLNVVFAKTKYLAHNLLPLQLLSSVACSHNLMLTHNLVSWSPYCIIFVKKAEIAGFLPLTAP